MIPKEEKKLFWNYVEHGDEWVDDVDRLLQKWRERQHTQIGNVLINHRYEVGSLLHLCVKSGNNKILRVVADELLFLKQQRILLPLVLNKFVDQQDQFQNTALMEAAKRNNTIAADILISKLNAGLDNRNNMLHTAVSIAAMNGHLGTVSLLIEKGANPLLQNTDGYNSLDKAIKVNKSEAVIEYLEPVIYEAKQWQSKNCLVKMMLNRRQATKI